MVTTDQFLAFWLLIVLCGLGLGYAIIGLLFIPARLAMRDLMVKPPVLRR